MGRIDDMLASIDNARRVVGRNVGDLVNDPALYAEKIVGHLRNQNAGVAPVASAGELTNRPLTMEERVDNAVSSTDFGGGLGKIVYHGSPHKFNKFDMSKLGTGEGAQVYGHGLYMADTPEVAQSYKNGLSNKNQTLWRDIENVLPDAIKGKAADFSDAILSGKGFDDLVSMVKLPWQKAVLKQSQSKIDEIIKNQQSGGALYKVDIPDEAVGRFLDWDKPLSEQAPVVRDLLVAHPSIRDSVSKRQTQLLSQLNDEGKKRLLAFGDPVEKISGGEVYRKLVNGDSKNAADVLRELGIPGIRYLDEGSRTAGKGSSNFVLFDDTMSRILERNGEATGLQPWQPGEYEATVNALRKKKP